MKYDFERFLNVRSASRPSFSPDGRSVGFLTDITGVPQLWSVPVEGGWPQQLTFYTERLQMASYSPTGNRILFGMDVGGDERQQLYLLSNDGEVVTPLTADAETIHTFGAWSPDGDSIAFVSNRRDRAFFDVYIRDLSSHENRLVYQQDGTNAVADWSPDGRYLLLTRSVSNLYNDLYLFDLRTQDVTLLTRASGDVTYTLAQWSADGQGLYLLCNQDREVRGLAYIALGSREVTYLQTPSWDVEALAYSKTSGRIAYSTNVDGYSELAVLDSDSASPRPIDGLPRGVIGDLEWSPDGQRLAVSIGGDTQNTDIWLVDVPSGQVRQLTHSARAGIPDDALTESQLIHYLTFDGRQIPAFFFVPKGLPRDGNMPVVVFVHGGPEGQSRPSFNPIVQYFAHRGYAVLVPNVRGSTGYGRTYVHLDDVEKRMDSVRDLKHVVDWLAGSGYSNPQRIAVMGGSYGGFMTLSAITTYPDLWGAAAELYGIANFLTFLENTGPWRRKLRAAEYGDPERDADFLREVSPINHVDSIQTPLMVVHGARDPRVPISETEQIVEGIRSRGGVVEYVRFEDEGHGIVKRHNRIRAYTAIADFLDKHIIVQ